MYQHPPAIYVCACGCGATVSRRNIRTNACHARQQCARRSPEERRRIAILAAAGKARAKQARESLPKMAWSPTSRML